MNDDAQDLRRARSRYNSRQTDSVLIAWICSPEWTMAPTDTAIRGTRYLKGSTYPLHVSETTGEIG